MCSLFSVRGHRNEEFRVMAKPFDLRKQLKLHDNNLLGRLFADSGQMRDINWKDRNPHDVEPIIKRWEAMADSKRRHLQIIFQDVNDLSDDRGHRVLCEEIEGTNKDTLPSFA